MILAGSSRLCWQALLAFLYLVDVVFSGYEVQDNTRRNWTSAAEIFTEGGGLLGVLARITSIEELCEAQTEIRDNSNYGYWTALKRNSMGVYQWGHLVTITANVSEKLLDKTLPDRCYVINKSAMKLLSKDCNSLQGVLLSYTDGEDDNSSSNRLLEYYSDGCIEYELSKCSQLVDSRKQELPQPWSCKQSNGMSYGSCQVEKTILKCCQTYCQTGNHTYTVDTTSDMGTKVRKVPTGYKKDVEISFNTSSHYKENKEVKVIIASEVFNDSQRVVAVLLYRTKGDQEFQLTNFRNFILYSDVVGVVLDPPHKEIIPNKVIIYFSHNKPKANQTILERKCVFWKEADFNTLKGSWSSDGCAVINDSSPETTICGCNHLTNFAVLMQIKDIEEDDIPTKHKVTLLVITYIGCALSLAGEVLTVFVYVVFMKFKAEGIQIRINLAIALFLAQVVFLSGIDATNNKSVCVLVAVLLHYLYLASFGWMLLEGVFLYIMIVEVFSTVNVRYLYLFAWGYPIIPVVISLAIGADDDKELQNYTNENFCWLSFSNHLSWAFIAPVLLVTLINFVILMAVVREIRNLHDPNPSKMKTFKKSLKSFFILTPLLGLTWVFGLLAVTDARLVFQYIFTILNSTQGMLIFLLHVLRNSEVRTAFHHKLLKWRFDRFYNTTSVNRIQGDISQSKGKRKRQIDPEESNNQEQRSTRQSGEQMVLSVQVSTPSNDITVSSRSVTL